MKLAIKSLLVSLSILSCFTASAQALSGNGAQVQVVAKPGKVDASKRAAAYKVAGMLADRQFVAVVERQLAGTDKPVMLLPMLDEYSSFGTQAKAAADTLRSLDKTVREQKAIAAETDSVMEMRLYKPKRFAGKIDWKNLLVAYPPANKKNEWAPVEAFDRNGGAHRLDGRVVPTMPVLVVGINRSKAHRAGMAYVNRYLQAAGMQSKSPLALAGTSTLATGIETSMLTRIRLANDQEPWISGAAEIFAVVSGVQPDQAKATLTVVDLPYLDNDGTDYSPNQILVFWSEYRYAAANVQFFEHDDNTNYQQLAVALSQGVTAILGAFAPAYAVIGQVATAILQAMPAGWFANDDDYVDSFYTLEKGRYYTNFKGVANNATMSLAPYMLQQQ